MAFEANTGRVENPLGHDTHQALILRGIDVLALDGAQNLAQQRQLIGGLFRLFFAQRANDRQVVQNVGMRFIREMEELRERIRHLERQVPQQGNGALMEQIESLKRKLAQMEKDQDQRHADLRGRVEATQNSQQALCGQVDLLFLSHGNIRQRIGELTAQLLAKQQEQQLLEDHMRGLQREVEDQRQTITHLKARFQLCVNTILDMQRQIERLQQDQKNQSLITEAQFQAQHAGQNALLNQVQKNQREFNKTIDELKALIEAQKASQNAIGKQMEDMRQAADNRDREIAALKAQRDAGNGAIQGLHNQIAQLQEAQRLRDERDGVRNQELEQNKRKIEEMQAQGRVQQAAIEALEAKIRAIPKPEAVVKEEPKAKENQKVLPDKDDKEIKILEGKLILIEEENKKLAASMAEAEKSAIEGARGRLSRQIDKADTDALCNLFAGTIATIGGSLLLFGGCQMMLANNVPKFLAIATGTYTPTGMFVFGTGKNISKKVQLEKILRLFEENLQKKMSAQVALAEAEKEAAK